MDPPRERLDSWKAIADYLGRDRTTVMRWERTGGLPVRRVQGRAGRSIFAYKDELDRWLIGGGIASAETAVVAKPPIVAEPPVVTEPAVVAEPRTRHPTRRWPVAAALATVVVTSAAALWWWRAFSPIATATLIEKEIVAQDARGRETWRHRLPHIDGDIVPARLLVADIDGDSDPELLALLQLMKRPGHGSGVVMVFEGNGELRWQRSLEDHYTFGDNDYGPAWFPEDIVVYRSGESMKIAVAYHHNTWWPGVLVIYDRNGQPIDRFVNAGWMRSLNVTPDGRYLLAAGLSNPFGGAALAVLDAAKPGGTSPHDGGSLPTCANCPSGAPVAYFVVPWSDLARPSDTPNMVVQVDKHSAIQWHAIQRGAENGKAPEIIIDLSPSLTLVRQDVNDYFAELRSSSRSNVRQPTLRQWTPAAGWRDVEVR